MVDIVWMFYKELYTEFFLFLKNMLVHEGMMVGNL